MKYDKTVLSEYGDFFLESKHISTNDKVADMLWKALQDSKFTKAELAERLDWDLHTLMMVMSADKTIDIYDMVHVAGALGYKWEFNLVKDSDDE